MNILNEAFAHLRERLIPNAEEYGFAPFWSLFYLGFLFLNWQPRTVAIWLPPTILSILVFLPLYFAAYRRRGQNALFYALAIAAIGFVLVNVNTSANTYLIYASAMLPLTGFKLPRLIAMIVGGLVLLAVETLLIDWPVKFVVVEVGVTAIVSFAICAANFYAHEKRVRQAELQLSHDEVRRLAQVAERERIGRDLHDLLGHTLSLITLKSELAVRLFERDPHAARREIADVERVARDALGQVRRAVTGIRAAGLAAELAQAHLLLETGGVRLDYAPVQLALPPGLETVLALTVREAVTNIQRHAHASRATVEVAQSAGEVRVRIEDDGRGGAIEPGNGLSGMRERLCALGGRLEIHSVRGGGTRLLATVPLPRADVRDAAPIGVALR